MPKGLVRTGTCTCCGHGEVARLNMLVAATGPSLALAQQFGVSIWALRRHDAAHITDRFRAAVRIGPYKTADDLAKLCVDSGVSVVEHLRSIVAILGAQLVIEQEAGSVGRIIPLARELRETVVAIGRITREYLPSGSITNIQNNYVQINWLAEITDELLTDFRDMPDAQAVIVRRLESRLAAPVSGALEHAA